MFYLLTLPKDDVFFRVNFLKFNVHIRNSVRISLKVTSGISSYLHVLQLIEDVVREKFNDSAATVMRAVLKATEGKQASVSDVRSG